MNKADAPESFTLNVRIGKRDIAKGCPRDGDNCPGALAILRAARKQFPDQDLTVGVGLGATSLWLVHERGDHDTIIDSTIYTLDNPRVLVRFIEGFDSGADMQPVSFTASFKYDHFENA